MLSTSFFAAEGTAFPRVFELAALLESSRKGQCARSFWLEVNSTFVKPCSLQNEKLKGEMG